VLQRRRAKNWVSRPRSLKSAPNPLIGGALSSAMRTIVYIELDYDDRMTVRDLGSGLLEIMPPDPVVALADYRWHSSPAPTYVVDLRR
jgi:hypothetical protein